MTYDELKTVLGFDHLDLLPYVSRNRLFDRTFACWPDQMQEMTRKFFSDVPPTSNIVVYCQDPDLLLQVLSDLELIFQFTFHSRTGDRLRMVNGTTFTGYSPKVQGICGPIPQRILIVEVPPRDIPVFVPRWKEGEPCDQPGCLYHISFPCEGCGRIAGRPVDLFGRLAKSLNIGE